MTFASTLAAMLFVYVFVAQYVADREARTANDELKKAFSKTFPSVTSKQKMTLTKSPAALKKFIDQKNNELDQKLKMMSKSRVPMLGLVKAISGAFPPDVRVDVNTLQIDDRGFSLEGVLYSGALTSVTDNLKKLSSLAKVEASQEGQRFTIKGEVVGR
jgi:hypothetical protein